MLYILLAIVGSICVVLSALLVISIRHHKQLLLCTKSLTDTITDLALVIQYQDAILVIHRDTYQITPTMMEQEYRADVMKHYTEAKEILRQIDTKYHTDVPIGDLLKPLKTITKDKP